MINLVEFNISNHNSNKAKLSQNADFDMSTNTNKSKEEIHYEIPTECPKNVGRIYRWYMDRNYGYIEDVSDGGLYLALLSFWYLYSFISELSSSLIFILADQIL